MTNKFYTYSQNNSGGYFIQNDEVEEYIIIEAENVEEADKRMFSITSEYQEYCDCCGERWRNYYLDDGTEEPEIYGEAIFEQDRNCIVYFADGTKKIIRPFE